MKKHLVFHPLFFAFYPVLEMLYRSSIPISAASRALIFLPVSAGLLMVGIHFWVKDWDRAGWLSTLCVFVLLYYGGIYESLWNVTIVGIRIGRHEILFTFWLLLFVGIGSKPVWLKLREPQILTNAMNVMAVVAVLLSTSRLLMVSTVQTKVSSEVFKVPSLENIDFSPESDIRPDIYYIIVDAYARGDVLQSLYRFDNAEFLQFLKSRGFYVAEESHTNYIQTGLSLASSLNLEYLKGFPRDYPHHDVLEPYIQHSRTRRMLESLGYTTVAVHTGYPLTTLGDADVFLSPEFRNFFNEFEGLLLSRSSAAIVLVDLGLLEIKSSGYAAHRTILEYAFEQMSQVPQLPGPKFVFYHVVSPHPPFWDENQVVPRAAFAGISDGNHFAGTTDEYIAGYLSKLQYTNTMLMDAIDAILSDSESPPIIIIQADHGPGAYLSWESAEDSCLWERTSILNAYYFPDQTLDRLYPSITPVNTFRVIFDTYFGTALGILEDRTYYSSWSKPYDFVDVTEESDVPCEMSED